MNKRKIGQNGEIKVIEFLNKHKFNILKHNYYCKYGEIDIIAIKNYEYYFIEVKSVSTQFINPIYKLNSKKKERIYKSSLDFLSKIKYKNENILYYFFIEHKNQISYYSFNIDTQYTL
jgi:putative endonuclease